MARTVLLDASTGDVTCGTVDGVALATLNTKLLDHDHDLSGNGGASNPTMILYDSAGGTSFRTASDAAGTGDGYRSATGIGSHVHGAGSLASDVETAPGTGVVPKTDNQILHDASTGNLTCDLINSLCPAVMHDKYDGHYHTMLGAPADATPPAVQPGNGAYVYFRLAETSSGADAVWEKVITGTGAHGHTRGNLAPSAYNAPACGGPHAGNLKYTAATGNLTLGGAVNGIDVSVLKADYDAHTGHAVPGATDNAAQIDAYVHGQTHGTWTWIQVGAATWRECYIRRLVHSHSGAGYVVGTPT